MSVELLCLWIVKSLNMANAEFDAFLETLAQLIEAKAKTIQEAADIIRDKKSKEKGQRP